MIKILLLIDYSSEFDRKLLRGLVQYSKENGPWLFYRLPSYYSAMHGEQGILRWAKEWKADAIIGQWNNDTIDLQKELNIPVVLQNYHHRSVTYSNLTGDYKGTGRMPAQFCTKTVAGTAALSLGSILPGFGSSRYQDILGANEKYVSESLD